MDGRWRKIKELWGRVVAKQGEIDSGIWGLKSK